MSVDLTQGNTYYIEVYDPMESGVGCYSIKVQDQEGTSETPIFTKIVTISASSPNKLRLYAGGKNIADLAGKEFCLTYDPQYIAVEDLVGLSYKKETETGVYGPIEILQITDGQIRFCRRDSAVDSDMLWTGLLNCIEFKALKSGSSEVKLTIYEKGVQQ